MCGKTAEFQENVILILYRYVKKAIGSDTVHMQRKSMLLYPRILTTKASFGAGET